MCGSDSLCNEPGLDVRLFRSPVANRNRQQGVNGPSSVTRFQVFCHVLHQCTGENHPLQLLSLPFMFRIQRSSRRDVSFAARCHLLDKSILAQRSDRRPMWGYVATLCGPRRVIGRHRCRGLHRVATRRKVGGIITRVDPHTRRRPMIVPRPWLS